MISNVINRASNCIISIAKPIYSHAPLAREYRDNPREEQQCCVSFNEFKCVENNPFFTDLEGFTKFFKAVSPEGKHIIAVQHHNDWILKKTFVEILRTGYSSFPTTRGEINVDVMNGLLSTCKDAELELNKSLKNNDVREGISWFISFTGNIPFLMFVACNSLFHDLEKTNYDDELKASDLIYNYVKTYLQISILCDLTQKITCFITRSKATDLTNMRAATVGQYILDVASHSYFLSTPSSKFKVAALIGFGSAITPQFLMTYFNTEAQKGNEW